MRSAVNLTTVALGLVLASCTTAPVRPVPAATPAPAVAAVPDTPVRLGNAYSVGGQSFTPVDVVDYDEVGYASWYGEELAGNPTANGEVFAPGWVSAAHRTLPMPSYVEVTRLDTGRTILVRVNDRGPGDTRRLIDLSAGAARQLGIEAAGATAVRVRRVSPVEAERLALRSGRAVPERLATPESLLAILRERAARLPSPSDGPAPALIPPAPAVTPAAATAAPAPAPVAHSGTYFVQFGAFSSRARAEAMARRIEASSVVEGNGVYRVRTGPFASDVEAQAAVARARERGFPSGVVVRDR